MRRRPERPARRARMKLAGGALLAGAVLLGAGTLPALSGSASAVETAVAGEFRRGPAPTAEALSAQEGPFEYATVTVPDQRTFDGGTIYYPTDTSQGTFGAVAVSPGFTARQNSIAWYGRTLASHGFVVFTIDVENTWLNWPDSRGSQLLDALDFLTERSSVRDRIDPERLAVAGHSMGGGGALRASFLRPELRAAVPLTPWHTWKSWSNTTVPTLIVGAENDTTAGVAQHSERFYASHGADERAYLELNDAVHATPARFDPTIARYTVAWLKRYVDNDTRYEQFLCPAPRPSETIQEYRAANCAA
ncbi:alpha/beta hydrolase [Streptomyces sp. DSM 44917]|uniref:Alpha/beta hydrolase n=1 Tax=Streptomyces boetiae TaxID=3075541 RepID=A0ABU2L589_9ACTN|nr:alpha/beta hydrolase [Streptomyces sp. DSM 44917]MDT0306398.1 alpha/beta hydrolase [Streptomyces sp. DSM 44917]